MDNAERLNDYNTTNDSKNSREQFLKWLNEFSCANNVKWKYFITLTFKSEMNDYAETTFIARKFYKKLNNAIFGTRSRKSLRSLMFVEKSYFHGYHVHLVIEDFISRLETNSQISRAGDDDRFKHIVTMIWNNVDKRTGKPDFDRFLSSFQLIDNQEGLFQYLTKTFPYNGSDCFLYDLANFTGRYNTHI
ncbi:hypothetical protein [Halorhodospira halophila]|uniref:hypothetical protein n=1 Tax=Halorhodospira halophila TaxID=1053 RepID=UPI00119825B2|nr:hypothetical protein [Halorhodospira halophila]